MGQQINIPDTGQEDDHRSIIENRVMSILKEVGGDNINVRKYYHTDNEKIFQDCNTLVQSGVPGWFLRTTQVDAGAFAPNQSGDYNTADLEILNVAPVALEKSKHNVDRYSYTMAVLCREALRENKVFKLPNNRRRPFGYIGQRDIYRDNDMDIVLSEFQLEYVEL